MTPDEVREEIRIARWAIGFDADNAGSARHALAALADMVQWSIDVGASVGPVLVGVVAP